MYAIIVAQASVAQGLEHQSDTLGADGSNPSRSTTTKGEQTMDTLLIILALIILFWWADSGFSVKKMIEDVKGKNKSV